VPDRRPLTDDELEVALAERDGWSLRDGKLHRDLRFADFPTAFAFMTRVAFAAERMDHHPEWSNVYDRVSIDLVTHDVGGVTALDLELADQIDGFARTTGA